MLNQDETPLLYSLVFGEGVVNDATSVELFNAIQSFDLSHISSNIALKFAGNFIYLFITSTLLGVIAGLLGAYIIKKLYFGSGYMSPKYAMKGHFSTKSGIFSFGVILLEIISGKKNTRFCEDKDSFGLLKQVFSWAIGDDDSQLGEMGVGETGCRRGWVRLR